MTRDHFLPILIGIFAALLFVGNLGNGLAMDDNGLIKNNPTIKSLDHLPEIFRTDYWYPQQDSGLYRPLPKASYALNYAVGGLEPWGFQLVNILLHGVMSALSYLLFRRVTGDRALAAAAGFLFAAHAVHTEVTANITFGRPEAMAGILSLLAMLAYLARGDADAPGRKLGLYALSLLCFLLALLCKESSVTIIGVLALYDFCYRSDTSRAFLPRVWATLRSRFVPGYLGYCVLVACYMGLRAVVLAGEKTVPPHITLDNPIVGLDTVWRPLNALYVALYHYLWKLIYPATLSHDYSYDAIPLIGSWSDPRVALTLVGCAALLGLLVWSYRRSTTLFFAMSAYLVTFSVVSNVILLIGTILGERLLYFPSVFFCLAAAWLLRELVRRAPRLAERRQPLVFAALMVVVVALHGARALDRTRDWEDQFTVFTHDLEHVVPRSAKALNNAGAVLIQRGRYEEGLELLGRAIDLYPLGYPVPYYVAALTLTTLGRDEEAIPMYEGALLNGDKDPITRNNLGFLLVEREIDIERGVGLIEEAVETFPKQAEFRDSLALAYLKQGRLDEARAEIEKAIALNRDKGEEPPAEHLQHLEKILEAIRLRDRRTPPAS